MSTPESMAELAARELEVLRLVGESLFVSEATVKTHLAHVYAKLSVPDRVQPVVLAHETGLVHPRPGSWHVPAGDVARRALRRSAFASASARHLASR